MDLIFLPNLPRPDNLAEMFGYPRKNDRVAFYWEGDDLVWKDRSCASNSADWYAWQLYFQHPRIAPFFAPFKWYSEEGGPGPHFLLVLQDGNHTAVGRIAHIERAVGEPRAADVPALANERDALWLMENIESVIQEIAGTETIPREERIERLREWLINLR